MMITLNILVYRDIDLGQIGYRINSIRITYNICMQYDENP